MINVTIDGKMLQVDENQTILDACKQNAIHIPTLCYLEKINMIGSCRLCVVEIEGLNKLVTSCNTNVKEGMVIKTHTERVEEARKNTLHLLMAEHKTNCFKCVKNGACELQNASREHGVDVPNFQPSHYDVQHAPFDAHPFLSYDPGFCIQCQRCISTCASAVGRHALSLERNAARVYVKVPFGENWKDTNCESCGNCAQACPTGAIVIKRRKDYRDWEIKKVLTTCPHCGTGCQMEVYVKDGKIVDIMGADGPSNNKLLCVKGRSGSIDFIDHESRIRHPLIKNRETGEFEKATWDEALDLVASKFKSIKENYGGEALAGFACSRSTNEDIYMLQKMVRAAFHSNNVDNCARV